MRVQQFHCDDLAAARTWLAGSHEGLRLERAAFQIADTFYDTADWMLNRASFSLRIRASSVDEASGPVSIEAVLQTLAAEDSPECSEWTQSLDVAGAGELVRRGAGEVTARVRALAGPRPLASLFVLQGRIDTYLVFARKGRGEEPANGLEPIVRISLEHHALRSQSRRQGAFVHVETRAASAIPHKVRAWLDEFVRVTRLHPAKAGPYEYGLAAAGLAQPRSMSPHSAQIVAGMSVAEVAASVCRQYLAAIVQHEPRARFGDDPEALHEMRVATRRLDAAVRLFHDALPPWARASRTTLRKMIRALGATRDLDVQLGYLRSFAAELVTEEQAHLAPLQARLETDRERARTRMLAFLDSPRAVECIKKWTTFVRMPRPAQKNAVGEPVEVFAAAAIRKRHRRLRKLVLRLTPEATASDHHDVRSRVKRLRYAIEAFAPLYDEEAQKFLRTLGRLQDVLGSYQDADVRSTQLTTLAGAPARRLPAETLFAMGRIVERDARIVRRSRERVPKASRRVCGRRWKSFRDVVLDLAGRRRTTRLLPPSRKGETRAAST